MRASEIWRLRAEAAEGTLDEASGVVGDLLRNASEMRLMLAAILKVTGPVTISPLVFERLDKDTTCIVRTTSLEGRITFRVIEEEAG
jgi:hypothetical protein